MLLIVASILFSSCARNDLYNIDRIQDNGIPRVENTEGIEIPKMQE